MLRRVSAVPVLAKRFLLSKGSGQFLSFIAWITVFGVALGTLALTVVTSVINGFEGELSRAISGMYGDVLLYSRGEPVSEPASVEARIRKAVPELETLSASFFANLMISGSAGVAGAVLEGVDPATIGKVTAIPSRMVEGDFPESDREIALGKSMAERIGAKVGEEIRVIAPFAGGAEDEDSIGVPKVITARVSGIFQMGMHEYDSKFVFATLGTVQNFLGQPGKVMGFRLKLKEGSNSRRVSDRLSESFGYPFRAKDWGQMNKNLFYSIQLEKVVIAIILTIIVIVAAFNVISTLVMMIHDKTKEIAILKAMGLQRSQSFQLFCLIGMGIGAAGTAFGILAGLLLCWILSRTKWIELPADVYYIGFLPVTINWTEVGLIAAVALAITFAATLYPAYSVSTRSPLDGIRYE